MVAAREAGCAISQTEPVAALAPLEQDGAAVDLDFAMVWSAGEGWTEGTDL